MRRLHGDSVWLQRGHRISTIVRLRLDEDWGSVASKEAVGAMGIEAGSTESGVGWSRAVPASRGLLGRRRSLAPGIPEVRGPAASMRRDAVFRRLLLVADVLAIVGAFVADGRAARGARSSSPGPASPRCRS